MTLIERQCTNCGAGVAAVGPGETPRCTYCGRTFEPRAPLPPPPEPEDDRVEDPAPPSPVAARTTGRIIGLSVAVTIIGIITSVGASLYHAHAVAPLLTTVSSMMASLPKLPLPLTDRSIWESTGVAPTVITIAGKEAVLGVMRMEADELYVVATESTHATRLWRYGPLGPFTTAYGATLFGAAAGKVVVADFHSDVHLVDAESGKETASFRLSDRTNAICFTKGTAWIGTVDRHGFSVDLTAGSARAAPRPAGCQDAVTPDTVKGPRFARDDASRVWAPRVPGFLAKKVLSDGNISVASGIRSPGTETPRAVGFDTKTKAVLWNATLFSAAPEDVHADSKPADDLAGGRYVGVYQLEPDKWHLSALDAKTGAHLWDTQLPSIFAVDWIEVVKATATNVYVLRMGSLEIYDAKTGVRIGVIGNEIYRAGD